MAKINIFGRCYAVCHFNIEATYDEDCTGKKRVTDDERAELTAKERNLH